MTTVSTDANNAIRVRHAELADLLAVFRIENEAFSQPWPFSAFEHYLDAPAFLVAEENGAVVGYVVGDVVPNHGHSLGHIKDIAVHPERRGQGIGTMLLARAISVLQSQPVHAVKLEVRESNESALSLYDEFGFKHLDTSVSYYDDGEDALIMLLDLDNRFEF